MTRFYYGAIHPLNVEQYTLREIVEYQRQMDEAQAAMEAGG